MNNDRNKEKVQVLTLRIPKSLHNDLKKLADSEGTTLNQLCLYLLAKGVGEKNSNK